MRRQQDLRIVVHVAGAPTTEDDGARRLQRCVACGFVLIDNSGALVAGDDAAAAWWPAGALIGTDKTAEGRGGMTYAIPEGRRLDDNEQACT